jgi:hypothetical protein
MEQQTCAMKPLTFAYGIHFAIAAGSLLIGILTADVAMYVLSVFWLALMANWKLDQLLQSSGRTASASNPPEQASPSRIGTASTSLFVAASLMNDLEAVVRRLSAELDVNGLSGEQTENSALASRLTRATIQLGQLRGKLKP